MTQKNKEEKCSLYVTEKNAVCMLLITIVHKIKKVCIFLKLKL